MVVVEVVVVVVVVLKTAPMDVLPMATASTNVLINSREDLLNLSLKYSNYSRFI